MEQPSLVAPPPPPPAVLRVARWPSEIPLLVLVALASAGLWLLLAISIIGIAYAALLAVLFFFVHVGFVTYLRGSAVRLGPEQFPELHRRVEELARRAGLDPVPEAYLLQADGSLNALATRFFRSRMIVLFTDLLDACGGDTAARDMILGHEIGHIAAGHLRWHWFLLPGMFVPFLGAAYSRARELTCDRWGAALAGDATGATRGLALLAAGGRLAPQVNLRSYVDQQRHLDTGWMTLGRWLAPYPPLSARVAALEPALAAGLPIATRGPARAAAILAGFMLVPIGLGTVGAVALMRQVQQVLQRAGPASGAGAGAGTISGLGSATESAAGSGAAHRSAADTAAAHAQVERDLARLETALQREWSERGKVPVEDVELGVLWGRLHPGEPYPADPFGDGPYGYYLDDATHPVVYSVGPDGELATDDDIDHPVELPARPDGAG